MRRDTQHCEAPLERKLQRGRRPGGHRHPGRCHQGQGPAQDPQEFLDGRRKRTQPRGENDARESNGQAPVVQDGSAGDRRRRRQRAARSEQQLAKSLRVPEG